MDGQTLVRTFIANLWRKHCYILNPSVSEIMTIAYGFFRLHKKECAAINGDASRMIFKDPKSLNLKTTIVNSNKNASFRIAHPLCWRWAGYYTQIRKIRYPANHLLFFTYVLKLFLYFFKQTFCFCCSAHLWKSGQSVQRWVLFACCFVATNKLHVVSSVVFCQSFAIKAWSKRFFCK